MAIVNPRSAGVYGYEKAPAQAAEAFSPSKMGIVGWTEKGEANKAILVRSFEEFERLLGGLNPRGLTAISVQAFFDTGGQACWVVRVVPSDAVKASVNIDTPTKWTFTAKGAGVYGNSLQIRILGNQNFYDPNTNTYTRFDVQVLEPADFNPAFTQASETYEAVQFSDPDAADYILDEFTDERTLSALVDLTIGAGGDPAAFTPVTVNDEVLGTGPGTNFTGTLANVPVREGTLRIVAASAAVNDEAQTPAAAPNNVLTQFAFTLPSAPILDGTLRIFGGGQPILYENPPFVGAVNGVNQDYTMAAGSLAQKIHRENTIFQIRVPNTDAASGGAGNQGTVAGGGTFDLQANPIPVTAPGQPVHPGTVSVLFVDTGDTVVDAGDGTVSGTGGLAALTGFIDYSSGEMWADAAFTVPLVATGQTAATDVTTSFDVSTFVTKAASADNLAQGVALANPGSFPATLDGAGTHPNTVDLVDSAVTPTGNGQILLSLVTPPNTYGPGVLLVDYIPLLVVDDDLAGALTGDIAAGTNTVNPITGAVDVTFSDALRTGISIDADYQAGQVATDDGLGNLVGDVDAAGANTVNYDTGAVDVTFAAAVPAAQSVLANYVKLAKEAIYDLINGSNGTAVSRNEVSIAALEASGGGVFAFDIIDEPLNLVVPDFEGSTLVHQDLVDFCEARAANPTVSDRFLVMAMANGVTPAQAIQYVLVTQAFDTKIGAIYYPNVRFIDESTDSVVTLPASPFAAGVMAKTANNKNVGKAPAGAVDGLLDAPRILGLERDLKRSEMDDLYSARINPLIDTAATNRVVWGAKSLSNEKRWRYVNARLLHNFLRHRIRFLLQTFVFENNGPALWLRINQTIKGDLDTLFRQGYFAGNTPAEAFFVQVDGRNNSTNSNKVNVKVAFAPNTPAEFIIFTLEQPVGVNLAA